MRPQLLKVETIDEWPPLPGGSSVWVIKGEVQDTPPFFVKLKTTHGFKASLAHEMFKAGRLVWVTWMEVYRGDPWLRTIEPDETKFVHQEAV